MILRRIADEAGKRGIPVIGLGFGKDWKEDFLVDLADRSVGAQPGSQAGLTYYIPKPAEANQIFQAVYQSMQVVAQEVAINIRMVQGLEARRVWQVVPMIKDLDAGLSRDERLSSRSDNWKKAAPLTWLRSCFRLDRKERCASPKPMWFITPRGAARSARQSI